MLKHHTLIKLTFRSFRNFFDFFNLFHFIFSICFAIILLLIHCKYILNLNFKFVLSNPMRRPNVNFSLYLAGCHLIDVFKLLMLLLLFSILNFTRFYVYVQLK